MGERKKQISDHTMEFLELKSSFFALNEDIIYI